MSLLRTRQFWIVGAILFALVAAVTGYGLVSAASTPIVRRLSIKIGDWPTGAKPVRMVFASDLHVSNLGSSKARIERVIAQINALQPDVILLGGDFVGGTVQDHPEKIASALAPLGRLRAPLGVIAVLGNHDHWSDAETIRRVLNRAGIRILSNSATSAGPLVIGGVDDQWTHHARLNPTERSMMRRKGVMVMLAHSPDVFVLERLPVALTLAGHTHCGQIALPWYGPIIVPTKTGRRFACGLYEEGGRSLVVSGGIGTSQVPIRLFAPPDLWSIEIGPG